MLEAEVKKELSDTLIQEELFWNQKSRKLWIKDGDWNTRFFHISTMNRLKRNKIDLLQDDAGKWIQDQAQLKNMAVQFFCKLFTDEGTSSIGAN